MKILLAFVMVPLAAAFILILMGKVKHVFIDLLGNAVTALMFFLSLTLIGKGNAVFVLGKWMPPAGTALVLDGFSALMLVIINFIAFLAAVYSISYMEKFTSKAKFYSLVMVMLAGMNGFVLTGDIFSMFVFFEIASIASYVLVGFGTADEEYEASFKYMVLSSVGGVFILLSIALLYGMTGTLNLAQLSQIISGQGAGIGLFFTVTLLIAGFATKAAIIPFHAWLPDAHQSAPAPVSAMLSGVVIKALGAYAIMRILANVFGTSVMGKMWPILMLLGAVSMVAGGLLAIGQKDYKRLLAYSSISQIGYIMLGFGTGTPLGYLAALFHLFNHAMFKPLLFFNAGAVEYATHTRDLTELGGISEKMPVTGAASMIGTFSISGIPPFNGFWSKLLIIIALIQAGNLGYGITTVLVSVLTLAYFLKVQRSAFLGKLRDSLINIKEVPASMCIVMVVLSLVCVAVGLDMLSMVKGIEEPWVIRHLIGPARDALVNGTGYALTILQK